MTGDNSASPIQASRTIVPQLDTIARRLHLSDAYRVIRKDLQEAAAIQATLLPSIASLGKIRYSAVSQPAGFLTGDSYNVVEHGDGRVRFFQLDVAGHGAPAALVSLVGHYCATQAIRSLCHVSLDAMAVQLNNDWPTNLPYFTMVLGEIEPSAGRAVIVQAGHPAPLLLRAEGTIQAIGNGGLPIGLITEATYEQIEVTFHRGDRLVVYSDGLTEAENPQGEPFSSERLMSLVQQQEKATGASLLTSIEAELRNWRGSHPLEDDLSALVIEQT